MTDNDPPRPVHLPFGYDEDDPYEEEDTATYPDWWRQNIELFREYGLRPYRPPQFSDGEYTPQVIRRLEEQYGIVISLRSCNPHEGSRRELVVDGEHIATIEHQREAEGYTKYDIPSGEFERLIRSSVADSRVE